MAKTKWLTVVMCCMLVMLAACGEKSKEDVLNDIEGALEDVTSYRSKGTMVLETGQEPQTYDVEVWQKDNAYYKVILTNANNKQSQIILKNDEGVFVLTPALDKTFRFQSDWPKTSSQAYLYESLLKDISLDADVVFTQDEAAYVFKTMTNYQNKNLSNQEIRLNKKDLSPVSVKIMDADGQVLVDLNFEEFEKNPALAKEDFDTEKTLTGAKMSEPTIAAAEESEEEELEVLYPMFVPDGVSDQPNTEIVEVDDRKTYVQQYEGEARSFTLIQEESAPVEEASASFNVIKGDPVDLGFTIGVQASGRVMWSHNGSDFFLVSDTIEQEELVEVARSVYGRTMK
ncbi:outer membrane lipoprotein carrier protein LolA [Bacillus sp. FSL W7-1360]